MITRLWSGKWNIQASLSAPICNRGLMRRAHAEESPEKPLETLAAGPAPKGPSAPVTGGPTPPAAEGVAASMAAGAAKRLNAGGRQGVAAPVAGGAGAPPTGGTAKLPDARGAGSQPGERDGGAMAALDNDAALFARLDALARLEEQGEEGEEEEEEDICRGGMPGREAIVGRKGRDGGATAGEFDEEDRMGDVLGVGSETLYEDQARESVGASAAHEESPLSMPAVDQAGSSGSGGSTSAAPGMRRGFLDKPKAATRRRSSPETGAPQGAQHGNERGGAPTQPYPKAAPLPGDPGGGGPPALPGAQPGAVVERVPALPHPRPGNPGEGSGSNVQRAVPRGILKKATEGHAEPAVQGLGPQNPKPKPHAEPAARPVSRFKQRRQAGGGA